MDQLSSTRRSSSGTSRARSRGPRRDHPVGPARAGKAAALLKRLRLHKVMVQALDFSYNGKYLASVGGSDDNNLVIWNVANGKAICGSPAAHDTALTVKWMNTSDRARDGRHQAAAHLGARPGRAQGQADGGRHAEGGAHLHVHRRRARRHHDLRGTTTGDVMMVSAGSRR